MTFSEAAELLDLPEALTASDAALRDAFRDAGKRLHPDSGGSAEEFEKLQQAQRLMMRPGARLQAWLLENGEEGEIRGSLSAALMDYFSPVAEVVKQSQQLAREVESCRSALAKAMLEPKKLATREAIAGLQAALTTLTKEKVAQFSDVANGTITGNAAWQLVRDLLFLEKWQAQLREEFGRCF